ACSSPTHNSLVRVDPVAPSAECAAGGGLVRTGLDSNGNGILDPDEVNGTSYICNGAIGSSTSAQSTLVRVQAEPAGANCSLGGSVVQAGLDRNGNGALDDTEITSTS